MSAAGRAGSRIAERPLVAIYADESCLGNTRGKESPGGAAGVVEYERPGGGLVLRDYWVSEPATTNNRMAIRSAIEAVRAITAKERQFDIIFTSDSEYLVKAMRGWIQGWAARGWKRSTGALENVELWRELAAVAFPHRIDWRWTRGHRGHPQNEYANWLAIRAAKEQTRSGGLVESGFEDWLGRRSGKSRTIPPVSFPGRAGFNPAPALPPPAAARQT